MAENEQNDRSWIYPSFCAYIFFCNGLPLVLTGKHQPRPQGKKYDQPSIPHQKFSPCSRYCSLLRIAVFHLPLPKIITSPTLTKKINYLTNYQNTKRYLLNFSLGFVTSWETGHPAERKELNQSQIRGKKLLESASQQWAKFGFDVHNEHGCALRPPKFWIGNK